MTNTSDPAPLVPPDFDEIKHPIPQWVVDWGYLANHDDPKVRAAAERLWEDWNPSQQFTIGG